MKLEQLTFGSQQGWSHALPGEMNSAQTLVLAFAAPHFSTDRAPLEALSAAFPDSLILGCSTAGEIAGSEVHDQSVTVAIAKFEFTALRHATTEIVDAGDALNAGARLAQQLAGPGLRSVFVLSEGVRVNGTALVNGLTRNLPPGVIITGGLAADGSNFCSTWVLERRGPNPNRVCAVGFYGERLRVGHGCDGGWLDFGPERRITRAVGNVLYELDGNPALELYKTYLGDRAAGLPSTALLFPLAVKRDGPAQDTLVRTILGVDEAQQSLTFAGDLPQGGIARLMRANADHLIDSAGRAARQAAAGGGGLEDALAISVSCVGRRLVLGERTEEEVATVIDSLPAGSAHVGFYSYGEISPAAVRRTSELHNQTMTVTVLGEV